MRNLPLRKRGAPSQEIQQLCRPWLFQAAPGSYQFAVAIESPKQPDLFKVDEPAPSHVAEKLLSILKASVEDSEETLRGC